MNDKFASLLLLMCLVCTGLSGDYCLKRSLGWDAWMVGGLLLYMAGAFPVWLTYRRSGWIEVNILRQVLFLAAGIVIGRVVWGEAMDARKVIAVVLSLSGILVLYV